MSNYISKIILLSNKLESFGLRKEASLIRNIIYKSAQSDSIEKKKQRILEFKKDLKENHGVTLYYWVEVYTDTGRSWDDFYTDIREKMEMYGSWRDWYVKEPDEHGLSMFESTYLSLLQELSMPPPIFVEMFDWKDSELSEEVLEELIDNAKNSIYWSASDEGGPQKAQGLANLKRVKRKVAKHPNTSFDTIEKLSKDPDVLSSVAERDELYKMMFNTGGDSGRQAHRIIENIRGMPYTDEKYYAIRAIDDKLEDWGLDEGMHWHEELGRYWSGIDPDDYIDNYEDVDSREDFYADI